MLSGIKFCGFFNSIIRFLPQLFFSAGFLLKMMDHADNVDWMVLDKKLGWFLSCRGLRVCLIKRRVSPGRGRGGYLHMG